MCIFSGKVILTNLIQTACEMFLSERLFASVVILMFIYVLFIFFSHEDGTVRFWDASGVSLKPLYKLSTASIFQTDCEHNDSLTQAGEEEWPPFRKVRGDLMIIFTLKTNL